MTPSTITWTRLSVILLALTLLVAALAPGASTGVAAPQSLAAIAAVAPDATVRIIAQKAGDGDAAERLVHDLGGAITTDLHIINAFAAELPAAAARELAASDAVRWVSLDAPVAGASAGGAAVRDAFNTVSYGNNDGTIDWSGDWIEGDENNGPGSGDLKVKYGMLRIRDDDRHLQRAANLTGAESPVLSFHYRRASLESEDYITLEISADGGSSWTELARFQGPATDSALQPISFDVAPYASANTVIRFATSDSMNNYDEFWVEDLEIAFTADDGSEEPAGTTAPSALDNFDAISFANNDGDVNWLSAWTEIGESNGPSSGDVRVGTFPNDDPMLGLRIREGKGVQRAVDLSGVGSAMLMLEFRRVNLDDAGDYATLEISADGGATWTELDRYEGTMNDSALVPAAYNISAYASPNTVIRFLSSNGIDGGERVYFKHVEVVFDAAVGPQTNTFLETLNVPAVWDMGLTGAGVGIAAIDSGVSLHNDFGNRVIARQAFHDDGNLVVDTYGHGTHVAGIAAAGGAFAGVAPGANLVGIRISNNSGMAFESDTVAAMQWVLDNKDAYNIRVVNLSLNATAEQSYHASPIDAAAEILWFNGIVVVAAAGNSGNVGNNTINAAPANDPFVITVGGSHENGTADRADDVVAAFSAAGTTIDNHVKPDVIAPGKDIVSALSPDSAWFADHWDRVVAGDQFRISGTSMSAPMVAGAVALLLEAEPGLTPDQVKHRLMATGSALNGAGSYLDVYAAVTATTTDAANIGVEASQLLWSGNEPVTWNSVNWNSVNWNSVNWNSVNWNSVNWNSVNWNSVDWTN